MSSSAHFSPEPGMTSADLETRLRQAAAAFPYPQTPDIAARERARQANPAPLAPMARRARWALALVVLLIILFVGLLVSPARARVLDWIRIGAVRIFLTVPTPTATPPLPTGTPLPAGMPSPANPPTLEPTPTVLQSVLDITGETTLDRAQAQAGFVIQMPAYPPGMGAPDYVFLQRLGDPVVILVWMDENEPQKVRMSLSQTSSDRMVFEKSAPKTVQETEVGGGPALWVDGDYLLVTRSGDATMTRLITQGHTLIWTNGEMTFRLETDEDLGEAVKIAESIR